MNNQSLREAAQQALKALNQVAQAMPFPVAEQARKALFEAISQPDDEAQPVAWPTLAVAIGDPRFHVARGIMGTENMGQDEALRRAILSVLNPSLPLPPAEPGAELSDYPPLPEPDMGTIRMHAKGKPISLGYSEEAMRAYVDADRAARGGV